MGEFADSENQMAPARAPHIQTPPAPVKEPDRTCKDHDDKKARQLDQESDNQKRARLFAVIQHSQSMQLVFDAMELGIEDAMARIAVPDEAKRSAWQTYLGIAVSAVLAGISGGVGLSVAAAISHRVANKVVADGVKDVVGRSLRPKDGIKATDTQWELHEAFNKLCTNELLAGKRRFVAEWAVTAERLYRAAPEDVERMVTQNMDYVTEGDVRGVTERQVLVGWTNFLARAVHGGQSGWDPMKENGGGTTIKGRGTAIALRGAAKNPYEHPGEFDASYNNVDHREMWWAVDNDQRSLEDEHHGILEIHLWSSGRLNTEHSGYGMRLDNVGPKVRQVIRTMGRVRDVPINKVVRVSDGGSQQLNPPRADGAFMIMADGYIRLTSWARPHADLVPMAERAQDLSLANLEV